MTRRIAIILAILTLGAAGMTAYAFNQGEEAEVHKRNASTYEQKYLNELDARKAIERTAREDLERWEELRKDLQADRDAKQAQVEDLTRERDAARASRSARRSVTAVPASSAPASGALSPEYIEAVLHCIQPKENRHGDPSLDHPGSSTASGLFGYLDGTWNNWGGFSRAMYAPASVQWERARSDARKGVAQIKQNWPHTHKGCL